MPILKNSRHEKFAQAYASGMSATSAYVHAGYEKKTAGQASHTLLKNVEVRERVEELKQRSVDKADITRAEILKILANYARSHPDDYPHDTRLRAIAQLTKMTGWDAPDKVELSADNELAQLINRLRGGG